MMTIARRPAKAALSCAVAALLATSCDFSPRPAARSYKLSDATREALERSPAVQGQILGGLELLFGTPSEPRFLLTEDWLDEGFDPNYPQYPADDMGGGAFDDERLDQIYADNEVRFAAALAAIEERRFEDVGPFEGAPLLTDYWNGMLADFRAEGEEASADEFAEIARDTFVDYYPTLAESAELYRQQCLHCHGNEGGGDGPTSAFLDPRPRDYRKGIFKFTAVKDKSVPRREDLLRILDQGVYTTAMPSFARFSEAQKEGLVDYVMLLSMRGMVEELMAVTYRDDEALPAEAVLEIYTDVWGRWLDADEKFVAFEGEVPAPTPEMLARGRELFMDPATGNCFSCHGESGLGDGASAWRIDEDGKRVPEYQDDWGHPIVPRNLTKGVFRGGYRPIDIYRRIYAGINGTPMPAVGESRSADGELLLSSSDMWSLVHYVRSLSETHDGLGLEAHSTVKGGAAAHSDHDETGRADGRDGTAPGSASAH